MDKQALFEQLKTERPAVIHLSGKTCVGKSTFAAQLRDELGYEIIELDDIMRRDIIKPFGLQDQEGDTFVAIYRENTRPDLTERFEAASPTNRAGLPNRFWEHVEPDAFTAFCNDRVLTDSLQQSIKAYALDSQASSARRLARMQDAFADILTVKV